MLNFIDQIADILLPGVSAKYKTQLFVALGLLCAVILFFNIEPQYLIPVKIHFLEHLFFGLGGISYVDGVNNRHSAVLAAASAPLVHLDVVPIISKIPASEEKTDVEKVN